MSIVLNANAEDPNKPLHAFSLNDCVQYAQKNNVQVKNALIAIDAQVQTNREIQAAALPTISTSTSINDYVKLPTQLLPGQFFGQPAGTFIPVKFGTQYNMSYGANIQQILFDGQVFVGLQARATSLEMQKRSAAVTEEGVKTNIYKIYYQLSASKTQLNILDANIARLQKTSS